MVHLPARRLEKAFDLFADHRRSRGPTKAALRLAAALHAAHAIASHKQDSVCFNEYSLHDMDSSVGEFQNAVFKLNWACNGLCSQCKRPYLPYLLDHVADPVKKVLRQMVVFLRPLSSPLNMDLSALFIRIFIESRVLTCSEMERFDIPTALRTYLEGLQYGHQPNDSSKPVVEGLTRAIATIEEQKNLEATGGLLRFDPEMARKTGASTLLPKIDELSLLGQESDDPLLKQISVVQLCTFASCISGKRLKLPQSRAERLMEQLKELRNRSDLPAFLIHHAEYARTTLLNKLVDDSCHSLRLEGHRSIVKSAAFSASIAHVVTGAEDGTVCLWDVATGCQITKLKGHTDWVSSVAYSPDEGQVISSSEDHSIRLWDVETQQEISTLKKYNGHGRVVAFSQDGSRIAFGTNLHEIQIWNAEEKRKEFILEGHSWPVSALAFSRSGTRIVSGSWDADIRVWSVEGKTVRNIATLKGHTDWVLSAVFSPDDSFIVSGSKDRTIRCWDARTRQQSAVLTGHTDRVTSVVVSSDGHRVLSASDDNTVRLWDLRTKAQVGTLRGHSALVRTVAFSPDGLQVVAACWDSSISRWDISMLVADEPLGLKIPKTQYCRKSIIIE